MAPSYCAIDETEVTIKPDDETHEATKALATKLMTRLNLTAEQVRLNIERGSLTRALWGIDSLWCGHPCLCFVLPLLLLPGFERVAMPVKLSECYLYLS